MRGPDEAKAAVIDSVEAAYDLTAEEPDWLSRILEAGLPIMGHGLGAFGVIYTLPPGGGNIKVQTWKTAGTDVDFPTLTLEVAREVSMDVQREYMRPGIANTVSEISEGCRSAMETWSRHVGVAEDTLVVNAVEPDGQGVNVTTLLPTRTKLTREAQAQWKMLGAHLTSAHRIRRAIASEQEAPTALPHGAEAVLDPKTFRIIDAVDRGRESVAAKNLRDAAVRVDSARGRLRESDPQEALETWWALMQGRWSMVDWFDSDDRRFVLAVPNPPNFGDPRGLTSRELQVATYAALGDPSKLIGYRLGISKATVSRALRVAMHKLSVKTQAQLVEKMRVAPRARGQRS